MSATGSTRDSGMTLLEVLVAVAILSLISALSFPALEHQRQALVVRRTALLLAADLSRTRSTAIRSMSERAVTVLPGGHAYAAGDSVRPVPVGIVLKGETLRFFPDGTEVGEGVVIAGGGRRIAISVDPVSGNNVMDGL